jgi:cyclopropane fatty-acyl-phospholipid synthase-like methyltransferase
VSAPPASARLVAAVDALDPQPSHRVLEVGCGAGVAVSLVCERLVDGHMVAIDRSPAMIRATERRNRAHVRSGRLRVETVALSDANFGDERFDRVLAVRVGGLVRQPGDDLAVLRRHLAPDGVVALFADGPTPDASATAQQEVLENLRRHGFQVVEAITRRAGPSTVAGVLATA